MVITASRLSKEQTISSELFAIYNFSSAKESAGIERAVLANVLAKDSFTTALKEKHVGLLTKQDVYLKEALLAAPKPLKRVFKQALGSAAMNEVEEYRQAVKSKHSGFGLNAEQWFAAATKRINVLKQAEEVALEIVDSTAIAIQQKAVTILVVEAIILAVGLLITWAPFISIKLRQMQSKKVAEGISIATEQRNLTHEIDVISSDDLGKSAQNINFLTRQFEEDLTEFKKSLKK